MDEQVRVKELWPAGHVRTPAYLRGKVGVIERTCGAFPNPETQAYRLEGGAASLVRVRFTMAEIWGPRAERPTDTLEAEIYRHWLEPA